MPGIGVILNPYSKAHKKNPEKAKHMGFIVGDKASCKATEDIADLRRVADEFKSRDIDILAISGGDGTNHCTLTHFLQVYGDKPLPKIALLRGGTVNTVATSLGVKGTSESILSNLLVKYHEDIPFETKPVTLTRINDEYGFIFGLGVIYRFMEAYYKNGTPSPVHAAGTLIRSITSAIFNAPFACQMFERFNAKVEVNGKPWPYANYSALYTGSISELGLNFRVFYLARQLGKIHMAGFSLPPRSVLPYVPAMYFGKPSGCPSMLEEAASEIKIELEKPMPYTIDGDMKPPLQSFTIQPGPTLNILVN